MGGGQREKAKKEVLHARLLLRFLTDGNRKKEQSPYKQNLRQSVIIRFPSTSGSVNEHQIQTLWQMPTYQFKGGIPVDGK